MSSPVVGSARIEYTADLSRFAADSTAQLRAAVQNMVRQFEQGMARITAAAASGGTAAGNAFQNNVVNNVQQTNIQIVQILNNPTAYAAAGRRDGNAFGDGFGSAAKDKISSFGKVAGAALLGIGAAAAAGAAALTGFGLKGAAALESTTTAFSSLLGSADLAKQQLAELQKFAAATPFSQQDVLGMAQQYYAFADSVGMAKTDVQSYLTAIGDVGAVTGASAENIKNAGMAIGQIGSSGKVTLENLNQISEAFPGFNAAAAIANATGKTTAQVQQEISAGTLNATDGIHALIAGMQQFPGAAGAMEAQSATLNGVWSTFTDTIQMSLTNAFTPLVPAVKDTLSQLTPVIGSALDGVAPTIVHFATELMPLLEPLINGLATVFDSAIAAIGPALAALGPVMQPLAAAISALFTALAPLLEAFASFAATILPPLLGVLETLFDALTPLGDVFKQILTAIAPVFAMLASSLQPVIVRLTSSFAQLAPKLVPIAELLGSVLLQAINALAPVLPTLIDAGLAMADAFLAIVAALLPVLPPIIQLIGIGIQLSTMISGTLLQVFAGLITFLANIAAPILASLAPYIQDLANWLQVHLVPAIQQAQPYIQTVVTFLSQWGTIIGQTVIPMLAVLLSTALNVFGGILNAAAAAFGWVPGVGPKLKDAANNFDSFKTQAITALSQVAAAANVNVNVNTAAALQHIQDVKSQINSLVTMAAGADRALAGKGIDIGVSGAGTAGRALGGPVTQGVTYLVGEEGPEFFTAPANGSIIPHAQTMQMIKAMQQPATPVSVTATSAPTGARGLPPINIGPIVQQPREDGADLARRIFFEADWRMRSAGVGSPS